jgi:hypothetical protein
MTFSWWQYAVAWGAAIVFIVWMILLTSEIVTKLTGVFNRQDSTYNDYQVQQLYAENVNVRPGDPTTPEYGATHNAWQDINQRRRR